MGKLHPFAPPRHYNKCPHTFSLRFAFVKTGCSYKKTKPELAGVVLTQDLVFAGRPLAATESTVHWANNRPLD